MHVPSRLRAASTAAWLVVAAVGLVVVAVIVLQVSFGLGLFGTAAPERAGSSDLETTATPVSATPVSATPTPVARRGGNLAARKALRRRRQAQAKLRARRKAEQRAASAPSSSAPTSALTGGAPAVQDRGDAGTPAPQPAATPTPPAPSTPSTPKPAPTPEQPVLGGGGDG